MIKKLNRPIGIFDSGLGGLTVYKAVRDLLPQENIIYFGDTMRVPYGNKSPDNIKMFAREISQFLRSLNVKMIVVACNTVSSIAIDVVEKVSGVPVIGVIEPGVQFAVNATKTGKIIVIGTRATINSHSYLNKIKSINNKFKVIEKACPLFVPLVEEGFCFDSVSEMVVDKYLGMFRKTDYDCLILGCTHYPLLKRTIKKVLPEIKIIDSSLSCAKYVKQRLIELSILDKTKKQGQTHFYVSDMPQNFKELAYRLAGIKICKINIKKF